MAGQHNIYEVYDMGSNFIESSTDYPSLKQHWESECKEMGLAVFILERSPFEMYDGEIPIHDIYGEVVIGA